MFGLKSKGYYICALMSAICGIIVLALKVFKVLDDDSLYTLIALILLLLAFALYLRPSAKKMKVIAAIHQEYRSKLYTIITKDCSRNKIDMTELNFSENENHQLTFATKKTKEELVFSSLTFDEALMVTHSLLKDFVKIVFGESAEGKRKIVGAKIEEFTVHIKKLDHEVISYKLIENYQYVNRKWS